MPFVIMTKAGKEKIVAEALKKRGTGVLFSSKTKGMIISVERPPADVRNFQGVLGVVETSEETARRLLALEEKREEKPIEATPVSPGDAVIVTGGPYGGFAGIARKITEDGRVLVHLCVFGKGVAVYLDSENLRKEQVGELWR